MAYPIKDERCPYCGNTEFIQAMQSYQGGIWGIENQWGLGQELHHIICRRCGSVVRSYVRYPEALLKKKNRRI
jgi:ribosomal protein L37E